MTSKGDLVSCKWIGSEVVADSLAEDGVVLRLGVRAESVAAVDKTPSWWH